MSEWVAGILIAAIAVAAGLPALLRALSLLRHGAHGVDTYGAANDRLY